MRSPVGLNRADAKEAFAMFLTARKLATNQIELVDMLVEHPTENGIMDAGRLYKSPYTDLNPLGVDGLFAPDAVDDLLSVLEHVRQRAAA